MLSRVGEKLYWMARYIERAENTARLVNVNTHLLLDLPKKTQFGWRPLIEITGNEALFDQSYDSASERCVVKFLIGDETNPSSILSALYMARENARCVRDRIPREAWEQLNELYMHVKTQLGGGLAQNRRFDYLRAVILGSQQITGLLAGTMTHDNAYDFLRMGRNLERADMTTRIIDVRSGDIMPQQHGALAPFENIQWMSVLKSLTAYQMYRQHVQGPVRRSDVLEFLFKERDFPRAFYHCLGEVEACLQDLPRNETALRVVARLQRRVVDADIAGLAQQELSAFIDELQLGLGELNDQIYATYFTTRHRAAQTA